MDKHLSQKTRDRITSVLYSDMAIEEKHAVILAEWKYIENNNDIDAPTKAWLESLVKSYAAIVEANMKAQ